MQDKKAASTIERLACMYKSCSLSRLKHQIIRQAQKKGYSEADLKSYKPQEAI